MKKGALFILILFGFSQNSFSQSDSARRFLNLGLKLGLAHQKPYSPENQNLKLELANNPLLDFYSNKVALNGQLYWQNSFGIGIEIGHQRTVGVVAERGNSGLFNGETVGEYSIPSLYVAPSANYNRRLGESWLAMLSAGIELHRNFRNDENHLGFCGVGPIYEFKTEKNFTNLIASAELRRQMTDLFWLGFYVNLAQGLHQTGELFYQRELENEPVSLGKFNGTGFDFGVRLSWCFTCKE